MQPLCSKCRNYLIEGNDTWCRHDIWPNTTLSKSRLFNALMFECIEFEKTRQRKISLPSELQQALDNNPFK